MVDFISTVIERFGGRVAGSEAERGAQQYAREVLESCCDEVHWHEFQSALGAKFHSLKGFCIAFVAAIILYAWNIYAAALVAGINAVLFFGHFVTYRDWLDPLYKQHTSMNVIGRIEPKNEVKSTLIISGHMDSVKEFQWWYRWKNIGGVLTTISGLLLVFQGLTYVAAAITFALMGQLPFVFDVCWYVHIAMAPVLVTFFAMHGEHKVDGALDNLTGVALAVEMAKQFSGDKRLEHTRLKVISFGSEETGLRGSRNYVSDHLDELRVENAAVFNIDTIKSEENLSIVQRELNPMVKYPAEMVQRTASAFEQAGVPYLKVNMPVGATDGAAFQKAGIPTVSIIGLTVKKFDPTYHTRLDNLSNLDPRGLEAMKKVTMQFIRDWDADHRTQNAKIYSTKD
jgi:hypothetical protein